MVILKGVLIKGNNLNIQAVACIKIRYHESLYIPLNQPGKKHDE